MLFKYIVLLQCFNMCKNCRLKLLVITNITFKRKYNKAHSPYVQEYIHCIWIWKIKLRITYLIAKVYSLGSHFFFILRRSTMLLHLRGAPTLWYYCSALSIESNCSYTAPINPQASITSFACSLFNDNISKARKSPPYYII